MSADNGIYVLVSQSPSGKGKEYRVTGASASGLDEMFDCLECGCDLYWSESCGTCEQWQGFMQKQRETYDRDFLVPTQAIVFFGNCHVYTDKGAALGCAYELAYGRDCTFEDGPQYGVVTLDYSEVPFPVLKSLTASSA